ncbi:NADH dehydrogenase FAD-containing subunit [Halomonas ventosae]|uniref:NADH dehydrogenase FAD-containing subunit n=1 Tax=Halomonas ventosae TaxID=229007 RepID=A0A4R6ZWT2_9GAMM|nr:FAD-dependent oxidoreductase [Halomonas ventosae]TDR57350.1 NADH dehydrogenase FAD-containing subunit [Halomonas ventosae]
MTPTPPRAGRPHLLLVGAGHAHLHLIRHRHRIPGAEVTLVDPGSFWYSGRATGMLGAGHTAAEDRLDPTRLASHFGARALRGRLAQLDPQARIARLEDGREFDFSLLSLNLGSRTPCPARRTPGPQVWAVKPIPRLLALRHRLEQEFSRGLSPRLVVVGGGPSGVEVACQLRQLARRHGARPEILLVSRGQQLLAGAPAGAVRWLMRQLDRREIRVGFGLDVTGHAAGGVTFATEANAWGEDSLQWLPADHVVHATGLAPPEVVERLGLPLIPGRGLAVEATLQSPGHPDIFAAGDCAAMLHHELPRLRIHGIRQAPVLLDNLAARLAGGPLTPYVPQRLSLAILDLGAGQGLAIRGRRWWGGRLALAFKRRLDRRFLRQFRP